MNKRMELERYSNKVLKVISEQKNSPVYDKMIREIMGERFICSDYPYRYVYHMYRTTTGVEKLAYGDCLASHLMNGEHFIMEDDLNSLLPTLSVNNLVELSNCKNENIRDKARTCLVDEMGVELDEVVITRPKNKIMKMNESKIISLRRKGD